MKNSYYRRLRGLFALTLMLVLGASGALAQWTAMQSLNDGRSWHHVAIANAGNNDRIYTFGGVGVPPGGTGTVAITGGYYLGIQNGKQWNPTAAMSQGRYSGYGATVNNKIYLIGGYASSSSLNISVEEFDPATNTYTPKAQMQSPMVDMAGAVIGDKIYVMGGATLSGTSLAYSAQTWMYDVTQDTWTKLNDAPLHDQYMTASAIGNTIYLISGSNENGGYNNKAYKGTVSGNTITWSPIANLPVARTRSTSGVLNGKLYVGTGATSAGAINNMWVYDEAGNKWDVTYPVPTATYNVPNMVSDGNALYLVGGYQSPGVYKFVPGEAVALATLSTNEILIGLKPGGQKNVSTTLANNGIIPLTGTVEIPTDAKNWLSTSSGTINTQPGVTQNLNFNVSAANVGVGVYSAQVTVNTNDPKNPAQQIRVRLYVSDNLVEQQTRVVVEEGTGDWCGYCPYGRDSLLALKDKFGDQVVVLSYHGGSQTEPMQLSTGVQIVQRLGLPGWPSASIQRHTWPGDDVPMINRGLWKSRATQYLNEHPMAPAALEVTNYNYDNATRKVTATVTVHITEPILMGSNTSINLTAAVTQDSIVYTQTFYPPTGPTQYLDPYVNPDVVRAIWPSADGQKLTIPASAIVEGVLVPGTTLTQEVSFTIPAVSASDPRLAFVPEKSNFVAFAHINEGTTLTDILQGYEQHLAEAQAPSLALNTDKREQTVPVQTEAIFKTTVKNLTDAPITVGIARTQNDLPDGTWDAYFCVDGNCLLSSEHVGSKEILPGATSTVELHVMGGQQPSQTSEIALRYTGGNIDQTITYTTHTATGTNSVGTSAVAGNGLRLDQTVPNPAAGTTRFDYYLPNASATTIEVFTVTGQKVLSVVDGRREAGNHSATIDAANLPNGVYTIVLNSNGTRVTRTMTVVH